MGDTHDNIANIKHVMGFAKKIKAGAVIHTGDWSSLKSLETVLNYNIPLYSVLGNADIDPMLTKNLRLKTKKFDEKFLKFEIDGVKIGILHSIRNLKLIKNYKSKIKNLSVIFTGHYHSQKMMEVEGVKVVRPGALENGINFAVFESKTKVVEFVNENQI